MDGRERVGEEIRDRVTRHAVEPGKVKARETVKKVSGNIRQGGI